MITILALTILLALTLNYLFTKIHLPGILGMITTGFILGPSLLNVMGSETFDILGQFKTIALIVILIRSGLGINKKTLKQIGSSSIKMSFIPGVFEGVTLMFMAHYFLGFTLIEGGILGFIIAAVSPAIVVPSMLRLKELKFGEKKAIPTLILAGSSLDDVFAITIFSIFIGIASGEAINIPHLLLSVPLGIVIGAVIGILIGFVLIWYFKKVHMRDTKKVIVFLLISVLFYEFTEISIIKDFIPIAGLLGIMATGFIILEKYDTLANRLALKFGKVWVLAEILLFVYIGSSIDIKSIHSSTIGTGILILSIGLLSRSLGVWVSLLGSKLNTKEKIFSMIAYLPKATVQAAIGAVPLTMVYAKKITSISEDTAHIILTIAVLSIVFTAPIGAIGIELSAPKLLEKE